MSRKQQTPEPRALSEIDRVVHEPARLMIMMYLYVLDSADFLFLERQTGLTRGNLSSHLAKLEEAGYVEISKEFVDKIPRTMLNLSEMGRRTLRDYADTMRSILTGLD